MQREVVTMRCFLALLLLVAASAMGCRERGRESPAVATALAATSDAAPIASSAGSLAPPSLPIPARSQAPESPPAGWCGETAIQEGLLHLGAWAPQRFINAAGHPSHPDLYSPDIPVALSALGVRFTTYQPRAKGYEGFARWIRAAIDEGDPVLAGVKILPTEHPEWGLDHFVLVVGYGERGLLVNTTWGHREWVGDTTTPGLSFRNAFYALRLRGLSGASPGARLTWIEEDRGKVKLRATCAAAHGEKAFRLERRSSPADVKPVWSEEIDVDGGRAEKELAVDAAAPSRFQCVPIAR